MSICFIFSACNRPPVNRLFVTDHSAPGSEARQHFEDFHEGYYFVTNDGSVEIVLRKTAPPASSPLDRVDQIVHIRTYWTVRPGRTHAQHSMLNSQISYCLLRGQAGVSYDGGGFLRYKIDEKKNTLTGRIEGADLRPLRRTTTDLEIFGQTTLNGRFSARQDARRAARLIGRLQRWLGELPERDPTLAPPVL